MQNELKYLRHDNAGERERETSHTRKFVIDKTEEIFGKYEIGKLEMTRKPMANAENIVES